MRKLKLLSKNKWVVRASGLIVVALSSYVFALRYPPAFSIPNFYAEDGKVFLDTAIRNNVIESIFTGFNGYLISGLYILAEAAVFIQDIFNLPFYQLPVVLAVLSCIFLGLTAALPYLLLRKQLGTILSLVAVLFGTLMVMPSFDYAIIGTIGNLKFLFLYWVFILILYRNNHSTNIRRTVVADLLILLSIFTYAPAIAMLPFGLWPYRDKLLKVVRNRFKDWRYVLTPYVLSMMALFVISGLYIIAVYINGIPKIPGYLDTPYDFDATFKILYRVTWYEWLFPISSTMRDLVSIGLVGIVAFYGLKQRATRFVTAFAFWAIFIGTASFVANRPGISSYFLMYGPNPDQFFYAQPLVFMVMCLFIIRPFIARNKLYNNAILLFAVFLFVWWALPATGSFGGNRNIYEGLGTAKENVQRACKQQRGDKVVVQSYPSLDWKWIIEKSIACN